MGACQIADVDVVAHTGPVGRRVVTAEYFKICALSKGCLRRHLNEMGGVRRRLAAAACGIGTRDVEIAQEHIAKSCACPPVSRSMISVISFELP